MRLSATLLILLLGAALPVPANADTPAQIATVTVSTPNQLHISMNAGQSLKTWEKDVGSVSHPGFLSSDFTGGGSTDIACIDFNEDDTPYMFVTHSPGRTSSTTTAWQNALRSPGQLTYYFVAGDFDGDGDSDVMSLYAQGANNTGVSGKVTYGPSGATATPDVQDWAFPNERESAFIAGLFRGPGATNDAFADVAAISHSGGGDFTVRFYRGSAGTYVSGADWTIPGVTASEPVAFRPGDFNGDGFADIAAVFYTSGTTTYSSVILLGPSGGTVLTAVLGTQPLVAVTVDDFTGDGRDDLAGITESGTTRRALVFAAAPSGALDTPVSWTLTSTGSTTGQYFAGNFTQSRVTGRVTLADGTPFPNATISAGSVGSGTTAADGTYTIDGFLDGMSYTLTPSSTVLGPVGLGYHFDPVSTSGTILSDTVANFIAYENLDTDGDGIFNETDTDDDGDGISDLLEAEYGTDPLLADTDGDGVDDGQEIGDGSDPNDRGSNVRPLGTEVCSEWNGFLNMWNIKEHANTSNHTLDIVTTLYDQGGQAHGVVAFSLPAGRHLDLLVHEMAGWQRNAYGKVCSVATNGAPGELDGRMIYYKQSEGSSNPLNERFDFAFALNFSNGIVGRQYVGFNTFQPSFDPAEANYLAANWIQLNNLESTLQTGTLIMYAQDGTVLDSRNLALEGNARVDIGAHNVGRSLVGLVAWVPDNGEAEFVMRNARYFHGDNNVTRNTFMSAAEFTGNTGTGREVVVPLDSIGSSAIVEISNVLSIPVVARVQVYDSDGVLRHAEDVSLPPHATYHLIANPYLNGGKGIATVQGSETGSLLTTAMQYGYNASGGITNFYGVKAIEALGAVLQGSYNTYINQGCNLLLMNQNSAATTATISMMDGFTRTTFLAGEEVTVPGRGFVDFDLCSRAPRDTYGSVTVQQPIHGALAAVIIRRGNQDDYRFPTFMR